jgi:hypothetical protein
MTAQSAGTEGGAPRVAPLIGDLPASALLRNLAAAPFIYGLVVPLALLDGWVSLYQAVCFRLWRLPRVRRSAYLIADRSRLPYLNAAQKLNCAYCEYANGVIGYAREIAARTEQYWCPIAHAEPPPSPHARYGRFAPYGDAEGYPRTARALRSELAADAVRAAGGPSEPLAVRACDACLRRTAPPAGGAGEAPGDASR